MAETLNGLDAMATGQSEFFWGSPILLYMWLLELFRFVSDRGVGPAIMRNPARFFDRGFLLGGQWDAYDWTRILAKVTGYIRWHVSWWWLRSIVLSIGGQNYVRIQGLHLTSFYVSSRLVR